MLGFRGLGYIPNDEMPHAVSAESQDTRLI